MLGAAAVLQDSDGSVLMALRAPDDDLALNTWDFVGGGLKAGEDALTCLHRELHEALGIEPLDPTHLTNIASEQSNGYWPVFHVRAWIGIPSNATPDEHIALLWFQPSTALGLHLAHPDYPGLLRRLDPAQSPAPTD